MKKLKVNKYGEIQHPKHRALQKAKKNAGYKNSNRDDVNSGAALGHPKYKV